MYKVVGSSLLSSQTTQPTANARQTYSVERLVFYDFVSTQTRPWYGATSAERGAPPQTAVVGTRGGRIGSVPRWKDRARARFR